MNPNKQPSWTMCSPGWTRIEAYAFRFFWFRLLAISIRSYRLDKRQMSFFDRRTGFVYNAISS